MDDDLFDAFDRGGAVAPPSPPPTKGGAGKKAGRSLKAKRQQSEEHNGAKSKRVKKSSELLEEEERRAAQQEAEEASESESEEEQSEGEEEQEAGEQADATSSEMTLPAPTPYTPAKVYKFKLDPFQQQAVDYIEKGESVLVAAHTSAGKTAVAEYAIAKSLRDGQRVIYTSPIKALSNQKYRDLQEEFGDVGLMTGDMTINPNATCLIMTTEILRSMLYRGSEVMREVAWVIYDEVHYMRDKERGVVWEESIILLPHKVRFVFLSATIPNAPEFVGWVSKLHYQPCHVVYTDYRPVPLQHFVFPAAAEGLFLVVDDKGDFKEDSFQKAMSALQGKEDSGGGGGKDKGGGKQVAGAKNQQSSDLFKIVRLIMERDLDPCIVFSFSKKECETFALQMARLDFNNAEEKDLVGQVFENALESLSDDDRALPQVLTILPLLKRGIGIHHGGLLPILKEVLEILFQEGLIKCLFATETFSIGINMPAKTVVFTSTRKFDGQDFRWITSGEYIQMSGRAGRRGKDDKGIVIQMLDEKMAPEITKNMIYGASDALYSSYHVSYNMVLNMLRVEDADPENILRSSFHQYQQEQSAPALEEKAEELQKEANAMAIESEDSVADYFASEQLLQRTQADMAVTIRQPTHCVPFLQPGRLVQLRAGNKDWGWGALVRAKKSGGRVAADTLLGAIASDESREAQLLEVLVIVQDVPADVDKESLSPFEQHSRYLPGYHSESSKIEALQVSLDAISRLSAIRLNLPKDLQRETSRKGILKALREVQRRYQAEGIPQLHPVDDMGIQDEGFSALLHREVELQERLRSSDLTATPAAERKQMLVAYGARNALQEQAQELRQQARDSQTIAMREELRRMKRVLKRLGYITPEGVLGPKGRFSCELSTGDELVLTDMVFDGVFNALSIEQSVSLLSCFIHKEAAPKEAPTVATDMQGPFQQLQQTARNIAKVCIDAKMTMDEEEYVASFNPEMMPVVHAWCTGAKFADICALTHVFEGSIIRNIRRLEELLRQLASAAFAIGNQELKVSFETGAERIRRGVVFAASLYL